MDGASPAPLEQDGAHGQPRFEVRYSSGNISADGVVVALPHYCTEDVLPAGTLTSHVRPSELGQLADRQRPRPL